ncbi:hypothetical protein U8695_09780 [Aquirufa antheringensis]|jgi:hypothetical protein
MTQILKNLINSVKKFKEDIEFKEVLVNKNWTIYGDSELIEYEFLRNGDIVVVKNGQGFDGTWRILSNNRLQIRTEFTNNVLVFNFSIMGILALKISSQNDEPFLLYDPIIVKNGDVENYLLGISNGNIIPIKNTIENDRFYRMFGPEQEGN